MSCILRFWGKEFNPNQAIEDIPVVADNLWIAGERRFPESQNILSLNKSSGINFLVSDAEFSEFPKQIEDAIAFLASHHIWLARLTSAPGLERAVMDFGAEIASSFSQSYSFPPTLLAALGKANLALELSIYPYDEETAENA